MPLNPSSLQSALADLFGHPPATAAACAQAWADAIEDYAASIVPPSTTVAAGAAALASALQSAFASASAAPGFDTAFTSFATTLGGGMAPTYTGVPPPAPLGIAAQLAIPQSSHAAAAAAFTTKIDSWFRTGTAVLVAPPNTVIPWS